MRITTVLTFAMAVCLTMPLAAEDDAPTEASQNETMTEGQQVESSFVIESFADIFGDKNDAAYEGILLGNIVSVDPKKRFIFFKPKERELPRMHIYIDGKTKFTRMSLGKRKRASDLELIEGSRAAVRVITKQAIVLADEIFIVNGEFDPRSRYRKRVFRSAAGTEKKASQAEH